MACSIHAIGRLKPGPVKTLYEDYAGRLRPAPELHEREVRKRLSGSALKRAEAELVLNGIPDGAFVIALDANGDTPDSRALAGRIEAWLARADRLHFVIGGADGLDASVLERAEARLSLGPMTWPHQLARIMLMEQLYRAQCIRDGHPYHRS